MVPTLEGGGEPHGSVLLPADCAQQVGCMQPIHDSGHDQLVNLTSTHIIMGVSFMHFQGIYGILDGLQFGMPTRGAS